MDSAWVFTGHSSDLPKWARNQQAATEVKKSKKLEVKVVMCCSSCVEKVKDVVRGMHGVSDFKTDRWNDRLTIFETPGGSLDRKKLVKKLKSATHDKKVEILKSKSSTKESKPSSSSSTTTLEQRNPSFGPGFTMVPWPTSSPSSSNSSPFITNPLYLQHMVGCGNCIGYPGAVCTNCGRGSFSGATFP